jgi:hypothetical protein
LPKDFRHRPYRYQSKVFGPLTEPVLIRVPRFKRVVAIAPGKPSWQTGAHPRISEIVSFTRNAARNRGYSCLIFEFLTENKEQAEPQLEVILEKARIAHEGGWCLESDDLFVICLRLARVPPVVDCLNCGIRLHLTVPLPELTFFAHADLIPMLSYLQKNRPRRERVLEERFAHAMEKLHYLRGIGLVREESDTGGERVWRAEPAADHIIRELRAYQARARKESPRARKKTKKRPP